MGTFYLQPLADELIRLKRYQEGLELADNALSSMFKNRDYKLWLSKAKAELYLEQLEECEVSLSTASLFAKDRYDDIIISIYFDELSNKRAFTEAKRVLKVGPMKESVSYTGMLLKKQNELL